MKIDMSLLSGVAALPILALTITLFGYLEPSYSHLDQSVSTLGAYTAEHTFLMNLFGLLLPGLLVSWSFFKVVTSPIGSVIPKPAIYLMIGFGLIFSTLAAPMDMKPIRFIGVTIHYICSYASVVCFLAAAIIVALNHRRITNSSLLSAFLIVLPVVFIGIRVSSTLGIPSGLAQRGLLLCIFSWITVVCFTLHRENQITR